ncbi:MAG: ABC transporter ATP-binding protein [Phycisphaerales bacterium]
MSASGDPGLGVRVSGVGRTFADGTEALRGVSFQAEPGSFTAIVGASGCGKTTLLRIVGGLERPDTGRVEFLDPRGPAASGAAAPGFCFQEPRLLPWRTVLDNVALPLELAGVPRPERRRRAAEALAAARLEGRHGARPSQLSGGMRMRAALARALVTGPRLLLLDEPFASLDEVTRLELDEELARLHRERGVSILLVTHSIQEAAALAERIVLLDRGPGRVRRQVEVSLPGEGAAKRASAAFASLTAALMEELRASLRGAA